MREFFTRLDPGRVLACAAFVLLPLAVLFPLGIAALAGAGAVPVAVHAIAARRGWSGVSPTLVALLAAFLIWGGVTAIWSLSAERSLMTVLRLAAIALGALVLIAAARTLDDAERRRVSVALVAGAFAGGALLGFELVSGEWITRTVNPAMAHNALALLNRGASVFVIFVWAAAIVFRRRFGTIAAALVVALCALASLFFEPQATRWAMIAGGAVFILALWRARLAVAATTLVFVAFVACSPFLRDLTPRVDAALSELGVNNNSISHRLSIWRFTGDRVAEKPIGGWGLGTVRLIPGGTADVSVLGRVTQGAPAIPLHPHSAFLQIWAEVGLPGVLIAAALVVWLVVTIPKLAAGRFEAAALLAMVATALTVAELSYGIWQGWWQTALWLMAALTVAVLPAHRPA